VDEQGPTNRLGRQRPEACRGHHRRRMCWILAL